MAASSDLNRNYHVFLSFRGSDVRNNFLSHLYAALNQNGIHTFVDSEELRKGAEIGQALIRAIEDSRIAIILFSENYASSRWCLEEVAKIMECKEQGGLMVFPVFYKVDPREVRTPRGSYRKAMVEHESKFREHAEKVNRWKKALFDAGTLSGWGFHEGNEAELIQLIVKELSIHLEQAALHVAKYPVGINSKVQKLIWLSKKELDDDNAIMIGIWGPGGIGKTTIAKATYNAVKRDFDGSSFLAHVSETTKKSGLDALQKQLLSEILPHRIFTGFSVDKGINLIKDSLSCKKVLLVVDDVDRIDQLEALAGNVEWFGKGSRIIVTSRDKHLLTSHNIDYVHEVDTLEDNEALDLFCQHAFPNSKNVKIRRDLIDRALHYANGLPLALVVLGSFLCRREEPEWKSTFDKLSRDPNPTINQVLKTSFDGLEPKQREIFLDIACFFKGESEEYIKEILDSCGFATTIEIKVLIERSLITNENGTLQMHDLVQLMGQNIVDQDCHNDPRKRSRSWLLEHFLDILSGNTGTNAVEAIVLDLPTPEGITISPDAFTKMTSLRMLIFLRVRISSQEPVCLPNKLRWLKWPNAPDLEFGSGPKQLVRLDVQQSHIRQLGVNFENFGELKSINFSQCKFLASVPNLSHVPKLESLNLYKCKSLASVPNLSHVPKLESLNLYKCKSLVEVHQSVGNLDKLKFLSLEFCSNLSKFPNLQNTKSLHTLNLSGCSKLENFPDILGKMEHLKELDLERTALEELPTSIQNLVSLKVIRLRYCKNLTRLPSSIYKLQNLESLSVQDCSNFVMFPNNLKDSTHSNGNMGFPNLYRLELVGCNLSEVEFLESFSSFPKLAFLYLSENNFTYLPPCINKYHDLERLHVDKCKQLQEIPQLPSNMCTLRANGCKSLQKLPDMSNLSSNFLEVDMSSCSQLFRKGVNLADMSSLEKLPRMRTIDILLPGREMPEWFLPGKRDSITFVVPQVLYDKFLGLALCVILGLEEGKVFDASCEVEIFVNGQSVIWQSTGSYSLESDHVWLQYLPRSTLHKVEKALQSAWSHFQVCFRASKGSLKECGFRLICEQQENDLRVLFQPH